MSILKFIGAVIALILLAKYVPYGCVVCAVIQAAALWKLVNN